MHLINLYTNQVHNIALGRFIVGVLILRNYFVGATGSIVAKYHRKTTFN